MLSALKPEVLEASPKLEWKKWQPGELIAINRVVWDHQELEAIMDVLHRDWFGPGHYAAELEKALAEFVGLKYALLTNSGSSALLVATQALQQLGRWRRSNVILHPACTFPTSCNPIIQSGMIPYFADVEEGTYNLDCLTTSWPHDDNSPISGAIIPHLLGNSPEIDQIAKLLDGRPLIEDCCDTLGSYYDGKHVGTFGDVAAFSFYGSHHITTAGVGGALLTDDEEIYQLARSMVFWGRTLKKSDDPYEAFKLRYSYDTIGYDMQMSEIQAAFGLAQMGRVDNANWFRRNQFEQTFEFVAQWVDWLGLPRSHHKAQPSWFCFPILVEEDAPFTREQFARHLMAYNIEIRPLFTGNITRHKAYKSVLYTVASDLTQANRNMERALFIPCWGGMTSEQTAYMFEVVEEFMRQW